MYMNGDLANGPAGGLHPRTPKTGDMAEEYVAARMKPFALMVLGGGHQLDLDLENDWGDPWVQRAVIWRMQLAALSNRLYPIAGLHTFDEPGLTWWKGDPFAIPHQLDEYAKLTGKEVPVMKTPEDFNDPQKLEGWLNFMSMRMKYLEQAWNANVWGTESVNPEFDTINQVSSSYAPADTTDGVDSRQNRPYKIISGHGGYSDLPFGTMQPVHSAETFRGYTWDRPHYFLPMWYVHNWATIRNAVWMSFATKLEGILYTPEVDFDLDNTQGGGPWNTLAIFEIAENNRKIAMVGDAIRQVPFTTSPVAVLHSDRQFSYDVAKAMAVGNPNGGSVQYASKHREMVEACFYRIMDTGIIPNHIDEVEAAEKGVDFLKQWKVIYCPGLETATQAFRKALTDYVASGGRLIQYQGDGLKIPGATVVNYSYGSTTVQYMEHIYNKPDSNAGSDLEWRKWIEAQAPTFAKDLTGWLGNMPYRSSNPNVIVNVHRAGQASYLLLANNEQDAANPRGVKHELIPAACDISVPAGGVIYDLLNGGTVAQNAGAFHVQLPAGDGGCLLHLPKDPGKMDLKVKYVDNNSLQIDLTWGTDGYLPFRLRLIDPAGNTVDDLYRATSPQGKVTAFSTKYPLGANIIAGNWTVQVNEWLTGNSVSGKINLKPASNGSWAQLDTDPVSIYFNDAQRIADMFAVKPLLPDYKKLNWDAQRVMGIDPKLFAIFGPTDSAEQIAQALRNKGMKVTVNPAYQIIPFEREENRGGAGPVFRTTNYENIYANTIVLPGDKLLKNALQRGHINRLETATFPGPGRAFVQWGDSCFQAGWQNVFVIGDINTGVAWLLDVINGKINNGFQKMTVSLKMGTATKPSLPATFTISQSIKTGDTPVSVALSSDKNTSYLLRYDGLVRAYDQTGKIIWETQGLLEGHKLALSPNGERLAIAGYPGLTLLDTKTEQYLQNSKQNRFPAHYPSTPVLL